MTHFLAVVSIAALQFLAAASDPTISDYSQTEEYATRQEYTRGLAVCDNYGGVADEDLQEVRGGVARVRVLCRNQTEVLLVIH